MSWTAPVIVEMRISMKVTTYASAEM